MSESTPQTPEILEQPSPGGSKSMKLLPLIFITAILSAAISGGGVYWWLTSKVSEEVVKQPAQVESLPGEQSEREQAATEALERLFEETLEGDYSGWEIYTDAGFGLAFMYPVNCGVVDSSDTSVEIEGKLDEEGNHWPVFRVEYHDSELYHPPEGADLRSWLGENDPVLSRELGSEFMRFGDPVTIAGFLADHVIFRSYQAVDQDLYYFVRGDQLYRITLFHVGRREDWDLYNKFLSSFTFF